MAKGNKELAEEYGFVLGLINSDKSLKDLFEKAQKKKYSADKFQAELRDTTWFKTHSQTEQQFLVKQFGDPASAKQEFSAAKLHVTQLGAQLGITWDAANKKRLESWAYNAAAKGWTDEQLRYEMGKYISFANDNWNGQGGETQEKLRDFAYNMGVKMSDSWYDNASRAIVRGVGVEQTFQSEIRKQAKALFPQWSKEIDAGHSVADIANPYLSSMSQILELAPGSINLFDPTVTKALQYKDPKTGVNAAKPLWQFEADLRNDPRWKQTQNAQNTMMQTTHQILADFGLKY